ncbi:MAG: hypothetical protein EBR73_17620 [Rhodobacteraceae bacterium]|nr:hypothetical protein [Paracoccaceae bacterium]
MYFTFDIQVPHCDFQNYVESVVQEEIFNFIAWDELGLSEEDEDRIFEEARVIIRNLLQELLDNWYDEIDAYAVARHLENVDVLKKAIHALRKRRESEEETRCRENRVNMAKALLQAEGYSVIKAEK